MKQQCNGNMMFPGPTQSRRGHEESMYENFIHEHKNFIYDHNDHSMKIMINDHKQSCHTYSMMHFMFYEIFQIKY